ncbi:hypothetical protein HOLDEFILI_02981, partial [Holdemania filiformis DSM 12042]
FLLCIPLSPFVIAFFEYSFIFSFILDSVNRLVAKKQNSFATLFYPLRSSVSQFILRRSLVFRLAIP